MHSPVVSPHVRPSMATSVALDARFAAVAYWVVQFSAWGWHCWWQASGEAILASVSLSNAVAVWGGICLTGLVLTDLLRRLSKRRSWLDLPTSQLLVRLATSTLALSLLTFIVSIALAREVYGQSVVAIDRAFYAKLPHSTQLFNEFRSLLTTYLTWVATYFSVALIRRRYQIELRQARLSEALQAAELRLLKSQLNPHFLFNALNGVRALIGDQPTRAQDAVTQLARTLRYTMAASAEEHVTLGHEMEMVDDYLALESLRLAERLRVVREISPEATLVRIPVMLLQQLTENAIKHGIAQIKQGGILRIAAHVVEDELQIEVENPRPPVLPAREVAGVGLANTARRLELLFGARASMNLDLSNPDRAVASVRIPT